MSDEKSFYISEGTTRNENELHALHIYRAKFFKQYHLYLDDNQTLIFHLQRKEFRFTGEEIEKLLFLARNLLDNE